MSNNSSFRVIIIGAGVAGLIASHCLQKAGIDHVVLERRAEIAPAEGASIAIYPHLMRILHQIGVLEEAKRACVPCDRFVFRRPDGKVIMNNGFFHHVKENHGHDIVPLERRQFLQILYDNLPDKGYIRTGCAAKEITQFVSGVEVKLSDGTVEIGDLIIGCDGVHSMTRSAMWEHANKTSPGLITAKEKTSMKTDWKCLIGMGPAEPGLGERDMNVVHNTKYSFLTLTQPDRVFFFVFFRLSKSSSWPQKKRYSDADAEELAASVASHPLSETTVFGEIWKKRQRGALISLEEGVLEHWHNGRIVLAGDSVHKITPNIALGGNSAIESAVSLSRPSLATLNQVFTAYQTERHGRMKHIMNFSRLITDVQAWCSPFHQFLATWVLPLQPDRALANQFGEMIRGVPKLAFVEAGDFVSGKFEWKHENWKVSLKRPNGQSDTGLSRILQLMSTVMVIAVVIFAAQHINPLLIV
ncbi:hypothetical protein POJ06DRAFT_286786 [Lipomyces tetrasporus]|uniref:FAD-binding domain-containing protein n=1 Tax=Lipomyces tetrasporus TaxID=54092 RepID=A0AAD7QKM6_9ASCO|nr:uncharacterized protein POJ06DRAFT_286786 [Lipomyces tetrasporus]KAJ8096591.1 hypothetical protein POJ06DRAFT_286786 [Lipomyces tetrasporus]